MEFTQITQSREIVLRQEVAEGDFLRRQADYLRQLSEVFPNDDLVGKSIAAVASDLYFADRTWELDGRPK